MKIAIVHESISGNTAVVAQANADGPRRRRPCVRSRLRRVAATGPSVPILLLAFVLASVGIGCVETAEHAAVAVAAPAQVRGSAFGLLAAVQSFGNLAASAIAGVLWTIVSPGAAFAYLATWMLVAVAGLATSR